MPECEEDGSFAQVCSQLLPFLCGWDGRTRVDPVWPLQVQCHTLTGYCWCVTSDGKPVSGSSVHNRTPVCSGTVGRTNAWDQ